MRPCSLVCILLLAACSDTAGPIDHLDVGLAVAPLRATLGDTVTADLTLTNSFAYPLTLRGAKGCLLTLTVTSPSGQPLLGPPTPCPSILESVTLPPGGTVHRRFAWITNAPYEPLAPGTYLLRATVGATLNGARVAPSAPLTVELAPGP